MLPMMTNNSAWGWMPTLMNDFLNDFPTAKELRNSSPAINVTEDHTGYQLELAVPGVSKEQAKVQLTADGNLEVKIEARTEEGKKKADGRHWLRREFSYQTYDEVFTLPEDVEADKIAATVSDGVRTISLPKKAAEPAPESRVIEVK